MSTNRTERKGQYVAKQAPTRRGLNVALASMFLVSALLGAANGVQAAAGDFDFTAPNMETAKTTRYTVTYFAEGVAEGDADAPVQIRIELPGDVGQFRFTDGSIQDEYPNSTHTPVASGSYTRGEGTDDEEVITFIGLDIKRDIQANEKITFTVEVRNPFVAGSYNAQVILRETATIGGVDDPNNAVYGTLKTVQIQLSSSGQAAIALDMPNLVGQPSTTQGNITFVPTADTVAFNLTLPFALDINQSNMAAGWSVIQGRVNDDDNSDDLPAIIMYQGSALKQGQASKIPFTGLILQPDTGPNRAEDLDDDLRHGVGTFTFELIETDADEGQVRINTFDFTLVPNQLTAAYSSNQYGNALTAEEVTMRFTITITNDLREFEQEHAGDPGESLVIQFPDGFDLSGVTANDVDLEQGTTLLAQGDGSAEIIDPAENTITFRMGDDPASSDSPINAFIRNVVTPQTIGETDPIGFHTLNHNGVMMDQIKAADAPTFDVELAGVLSGAQIVAKNVPSTGNQAYIGKPGALDFEFRAGDEDSSELRLYLPENLDLANATMLTATVSAGNSTINDTVIYDTELGAVDIDLSLLSLESGTQVTGSLQGFDFPFAAGNVTVPMRTVSAGGGERYAAEDDYELVEGNIGAIEADREKDGLEEIGGLTVTFDPEEFLRSGFSIEVILSNTGYNLDGVTDSLSNPLSSVSLNGNAVASELVSVSTNSVTVTTPDDFTSGGNVTLFIDDIKNPGLRPSAVDGGTVHLRILQGTDLVASSDSASLDTLDVPDTAPAAYFLSKSEAQNASKLIVTRAKETNEGVLLTWDLPTNAPRASNGRIAEPVGVQIWHSSSPYTIVETFEEDDEEFQNEEYLIVDGDLEGRYLVTMFFIEDIAKYLDGDAPDTDDFEGSSVEMQPTWYWWALGGGLFLLLAVILIIVIVVTNRKSPPPEL